MMTNALSFEPDLSLMMLVFIGVVLLAAVLPGLVMRLPGSLFRSFVAALFLFALVNPTLVIEEADPLSGIVLIGVDRSASQKIGNRTAVSDKVSKALFEEIFERDDLEVRLVDLKPEAGEDGSRMMSALERAMIDIPDQRHAGTVLITDGRVHDIRDEVSKSDRPFHALITGYEGEKDREIEIVKAPQFGLVGSEQTVRVRFSQNGEWANGHTSAVMRIDGRVIGSFNLPAGAEVEIPFEVDHAGANIVEFEIDTLAGELTSLNNRAAFSLKGVREKLRVLLVSGYPHTGERVWRNLLKSDASVDMIHFTILRPPTKSDATPVNELSLIAFPTRQLFSLKIDEFDLIIFDRYNRRGVLATPYFRNMADYVANGGAILIAAGPGFAGDFSLYQSPLAAIMPAAPTGIVSEGPFRAQISETGERHPVTRGLRRETSPAGIEGQTDPTWGRWFRHIGTDVSHGNVVMTAENDEPLLILSREEKGRVAMLMSDHVWLWARGYDGGGPHLPLLRRLAHWLMAEPDLDEETLRLIETENGFRVERQTLRDRVDTVRLTAPDGETMDIELTQTSAGIWTAESDASVIGLYRAESGAMTAIANKGVAHPKEVMNNLSTTELLQPFAAATLGSVQRVSDASGNLNIPRVSVLNSARKYSGPGWIGFRKSTARVLVSLQTWPLFAGLAGLLILVASVLGLWVRESR